MQDITLIQTILIQFFSTCSDDDCLLGAINADPYSLSFKKNRASNSRKDTVQEHYRERNPALG